MTKLLALLPVLLLAAACADAEVVEPAPVGEATAANMPHCTSNADCPSGAPDSCLGAFCDHTGKVPGVAGDGCYVASAQPGAPCYVGGVEQVCSLVSPGATSTKCCPFTGPCP